MKDGIYKVNFTTTSGTLAESVCLFKNDRYVGADFINTYFGLVAYAEDALLVFMHCTRQIEHSESMIGLPEGYDLMWRGEETDRGFLVEATLPGVGALVTAAGIWVA